MKEKKVDLPRSYDTSHVHQDSDSELQRLRSQALLSWEKEKRLLSQFGLQDGLSVLELGSGPGFVTEQLLLMLPHSSITTVEIEPSLIEKAKRYLQGRGAERVQFIENSITEMELPDNTFDFAIARYLFQHLPDPVRAAQEVWRVLKPGGKLVIGDVDDGIFGIIGPFDLNFPTILEKYGKVQAERGGNRRVGRQLWRILKQAGFHHLDLEAVLMHSDALGIEAFLPQLDPGRLKPLVELELMSPEAFADFRQAYDDLTAEKDPYVLLILLMAYGQKPVAP